MTKKSWAALTGVFLLITAASAVFIYISLKNKSIKNVPLQKVISASTQLGIPTPVPTQTPAILKNNEPAKGMAEKPTTKPTPILKPAPVTKPVTSTKPAPVQPAMSLKVETPNGQKSIKETTSNTTAHGQNRNIGFVYHNLKAKEVFIVGEFLNGAKQRMVRKEKNWAVGLSLKPGTYHYQFLVDGKKIRDPNNKKVSNEGKSILIVKPLGTP